MRLLRISFHVERHSCNIKKNKKISSTRQSSLFTNHQSESQARHTEDAPWNRMRQSVSQTNKGKRDRKVLLQISPRPPGTQARGRKKGITDIMNHRLLNGLSMAGFCLRIALAATPRTIHQAPGILFVTNNVPPPLILSSLCVGSFQFK